MHRRQFLIAGTRAGLAMPFLSTTAWAKPGRTTLSFGSQELDWYPAKSSDQNLPVMVYVHGGAWALGNKAKVGAKAEHFTRNGFHFASVGYNLYPFANIQQQTQQVGEAVNWINANASRLYANPDQIILMGHSAGCHLSSMATLSGATDHVRALVCNDTRAYDLPFLAKISGGGLPLLYARPFKRRAMWNAWSPISYTGLKTQPPTLVAWSGGKNRDRISIHFANALEQDGVSVHRFDGSRKYNHVSIDRRMGRRNDPLTNEVSRFLNRI